MPTHGRFFIVVALLTVMAEGEVSAQELLPPLPNTSNLFAESGDGPDDELSRRLKALEAEWEAHKMKLSSDKISSELKAQQKELDSKKKPTMKINGRIHLDYWAFPEATPGIGYFENPVTAPPSAMNGQDPQDRFAFRRIRIEMKGDLLESMMYRMQVDFADPSDPAIKDVYIGFKDLPHNQELLIGNQKRPLGLDALNSSRFNVFLERPFVVEAFNEDARRLGIAVYGVSDDEFINWRYGVYNMENISSDGAYIGDAYQLSLNGRVAISPIYECDGSRYLHLAVAGMVAHPDSNANNTSSNSNEGRFRTRPEARSTNRWLDTGAIPGAYAYEVLGFEMMYNDGPFQITSEYQFNWMQRNGGNQDVMFHGAYVYASYFLTGEHMTYERYSGTLDRVHVKNNFFCVDNLTGQHGTGFGAWQVAARYSYLDVSDGDIFGGVGHAGTLAMNWHWNDYAKMQFNAIYGAIDDHKDVGGGYTSGDYWILGTRFAVDF